MLVKIKKVIVLLLCLVLLVPSPKVLANTENTVNNAIENTIENAAKKCYRECCKQCCR